MNSATCRLWESTIPPGGPGGTTISIHFRGWQNALDELGVERGPRYDYTKQNCIEALQEAAEELGEEPTQLSYEMLDISPTVSTIQGRFESWKAAKAEAYCLGCSEGSMVTSWSNRTYRNHTKLLVHSNEFIR